MKQLYIIGILVAILLLVLMGLSKLGTSSAPDVTSDEEVTEETVTEDEEPSMTNEDDVTTSTTQTSMNTDTTPASADAPAANTTVVMKTNKGDITIELYTKDMPTTAGNFLKLAADDFYDGIKFHRIIDGFMIQGGDPLTKDDSMKARWGSGDPGYTIPDEFGPNYGNKRGTLSMANAGPNTGGSQFFINTVDNAFLNGKHPVFGRVVGGMDVVDAISKTETAAGDVPVEPIVIEDIVVPTS